MTTASHENVPTGGASAVRDLPLAERAALTSGASFWTTEAVAGLPAVVLTDGPHGVRAQKGAHDHMGIAPSEPATCFPPAVGLAQSWDPELVERVGAALGEEARSYGVGVLLGPGVNIKRDPRGGRNFEYLSEDPHLTGELGSAWVRGLQSRGVGASVKHFAANNAETDRMRLDSQVDERPLREIYLRAFERIVTATQPWTVMASYNRVNGVYAAENRWLLTDVLRGEWGFEGLVVSDWGAVRDRVAALAAGLDLAMPGPGSDQVVVDAVEAGALEAVALDASARRVASLVEKVAVAASAGSGSGSGSGFDEEGHHALAHEAALRSIVLLKNAGGLLPLAGSARTAVIGRFAAQPRYQGGGSSHVTPTRVDAALDAIRGLAAATTYSAGFPGTSGDDAAVLIDEAVAAARAAEVAVVFLGLAESEESEGFDRDHIELPDEQMALLRAVVAVQPRTVVVLSHGGVVRLADIDALAPAILDGALLGQAGGSAIADVLFGAANPSGRLAETVPVRIEDAPSFLNFPGSNSKVRYGEGIFVGYRGYDARRLEVSFPFGHGLSYTGFAYEDLRLEPTPEGIVARVRVRNTGGRDGREVVQFYLAKPDSSVPRAPRELAAFGSVEVAAGDTAEVEVLIRRADLGYWEERTHGWVVEPGSYTVEAAASSRDIRTTGVVEVEGDVLRLPLTAESTLGEVLAHPVAGPALAPLLGGGEAARAAGDALGSDVARMAAAIPLDRIANMGGGRTIDPARLQTLLDQANA